MATKSNIVVIVLMLFVCYATENLAEGQAEKEETSLSKLCKCAQYALDQMHLALNNYTLHLSDGNPPDLDDVIDEITEIAHNCTSQPLCRCPDGYFKTQDGYHCLKVSRDKVNCDEANRVCSRDVNARLAVAKDHLRLTSLADEIRHIEDEESEEYYWIGLSYNRTDGGIPLWTWEDGSAVSYNITSSLKTPVRKSLVRIDINGERQAIERVAISKNYRGEHWKQERCGEVGRFYEVKRNKYICEYVMFKLEIKAVPSHLHSDATIRAGVLTQS